jgi:cellulose synthase/poly-beta-1,6-N-acetylglucosamine synthase-like glycosyltransferase
MEEQGEPSWASFDRLRDYCRKGRAPWRREGEALQFLTTHADDAAPDVRMTAPALADALRRAFSGNLTEEAVFGLARRSPEDSARRVVTKRQVVIASLAALVAIAFFVAAPALSAKALIAAIVILFAAMIAARLALALIAASPASAHPRARLEDGDLPVVTILVPLFKEADALPSLAAALGKLDYPAEKLDIKLLLEERDHATIAEARRLNRDARYDLVIVPPSAPQTKPKACNYALPTARGDLLVIYDAEDEPEPAQLRIAAETFAAAGPALACVQARLNFYNADENWLTRLFTLEYCLWFDHLLPALDRLGAPVPLGGTSNIFRTDALIDAGGWDPFNVTEDADLGLRLARRGWRTRVIDATTYEEANCRLPNWLRQRSRWMKGFMQTWLVHRRGDSGQQGWKAALSIDLLIGGTVVAALVNPLLWAASLAEWMTGAGPRALLPAPLGEAAMIALAVGNLALIALAAFAPLRRELSRLSPAAILTPIYWLMMSTGAYIALWQLVTRPHFWEKTRHGLSAGAGARRRDALRSLGFD